jgi:hypothetical protein
MGAHVDERMFDLPHQVAVTGSRDGSSYRGHAARQGRWWKRHFLDRPSSNVARPTLRYVTHDDGQTRFVDDFEKELAQTRSHAPDFRGLHVSRARQLARELGLELEVVGPLEPVTADLRSRRMRVVVEKAVVVEASGG